MLADIANKRLDEGKSTILLLGQHLTSNEDPWIQIFKELKLDCNVDEFLEALELKAQIQGSRILIFIDAINEGSGKLFWPDRLSGFITSFKEYKWLGLVLSIRTSYVRLIAPEKDSLNDLTRHTHYGFRNMEYEASKLFFKNYNIQQPSIPLLTPEFQRPLFLKIFCDGLKKSGLTIIPDGMQGITKITNFFIKAINNRLALPKEFNYPESINMVDKAVKKLIKYKLDNNLYIIPYEKAFEIITNLEKKYNMPPNFIEGLISEGIISKNLYWNDEKDEEIIYITYERLEDHITASYLLDHIDGTHLKKEFENGGKLHKFVKDSWAINYYDGLIEALSVQIPEKFEKELYELIPNFNDLKEIKKQNIEYNIAEAFVSSLLWRKHSKINDKVMNYIKEVVFKFKGTYELFWETMISVSSMPTHPFNAAKIHSILNEITLSNRDSWWNELIIDNYRKELSVRRIIDWSWSTENKAHISDESVKLSSIVISWFLTTTNRELRDSATKALICILKDRINVLIDLLMKFEDINDPYVYERLFAVAYGCALRTKNTENLNELSEYIYKTIFDKDLVYPHVLLRDYARGVIEYTLYLKIKLNINLNKIRPPYKSYFPQIPLDKEIEVYSFNYNSEDFKDHFWSQNNILDSMEVERTREGKTASYGNFGRYEFQFNFENWIELEPVDLKNIAIKRIFDLGYDVEKHGKFDRKIRRFEHHYLTTERIGKKYQWIAMHELLAQVSDKYQMEAPWLWKNKEMVDFQGPWEPFIRDIDPTILKHENPSKIPIFDEICGNWSGDAKSWLQGEYYINPLGIINISLDDEEWFILEGNFDWKEPELFGNPRYSYPSKRLWYQIRSYLVKKGDFDSIIQWSKDKNFMGRWMPESHENTHVFNREYYWSPAFKYFQKDYYEGKLVKKIHDRKTGKIVGDVIPTAEMYWWESGDKSIEESFRY